MYARNPDPTGPTRPVRVTPREAATIAIANAAARAGYSIPMHVAQGLADAALSAALLFTASPTVGGQHDHIHVGPFTGPPDRADA